MESKQLIDSFHKAFGPNTGGDVVVIKSPGRVNLIGEHTDYNEGLVFPMAIDRAIYFVVRKRSDKTIAAYSTAMTNSTPVNFAVDANVARIKNHEDAEFWTNYLRGPITQLLRSGLDVPGMDVFVHNTLPSGSGLSSSAAMEIGMSVATLKLIGKDIDRVKLAMMNVDGEHEYPDVPCGVMDQMIVANGKAGHAMQLDCRGNKIHFAPLDGEKISVVIVNSKVKHALADGGYAKRKMQCYTAVDLLKEQFPSINSLRDVSREMLEQLRKADPKKALAFYAKQRQAAGMSVDEIHDEVEFRNDVFRRARHVVTENNRTQQFAIELEESNFSKAGELMLKSHESLRYDYNVTVNELDFLSETAITKQGVYGCRMTGGGFGGCVVALVDPNFIEEFSKEISDAYLRQFNIVPDVIPTSAMDGTRVM
jgi:galactokinase